MDVWMHILIALQVVTLILVAILIGSLPSIILKIRLGKNKDKFVCKKCGNCCRFNVISLNEEDIKRIKDAGYDRFVEKTKYREKKLRMENGRCIFVKDDLCTIHGFKPKICREFPFYKLFGFIPFCRYWGCCPGMQELRGKI